MEMRRHLQQDRPAGRQSNARWRFLHQIVQEYGAAAYLAKQAGLRAATARAGPGGMAAGDVHPGALAARRPAQRPTICWRSWAIRRSTCACAWPPARCWARWAIPRFVRKAYADGVEAIEPADGLDPGRRGDAGRRRPGGVRRREAGMPACGSTPLSWPSIPVTNAEFACFIEAGGYEDESLWTQAGQAWLRGEGKLDPETEQNLPADIPGLETDGGRCLPPNSNKHWNRWMRRLCRRKQQRAQTMLLQVDEDEFVDHTPNRCSASSAESRSTGTTAASISPTSRWWASTGMRPWPMPPGWHT